MFLAIFAVLASFATKVWAVSVLPTAESSFQIIRNGLWMASANGMSREVLSLVILLPMMMVFSVMGRQLIGFRSSTGVLMPVIMAMIMRVDGMAGFAMLSFSLVASALGRYLVRRFRMPFTSRVAIGLWVTLVMMLLMIGISATYAVPFFGNISVLSWVLSLVITEIFFINQITRSLKTSVVMICESALVALFIVLFVGNNLMMDLAWRQPELVLVSALGLIFVISRYTGLRLLEIRRFRHLLD